VRSPIALLFALLFTTGATSAHAEPTPEDTTLSAFAVGATASILPLIIGGTRAAQGTTLPQRDTGLVVAAVGLGLAPIASHVAVREYDRAALFGAVPMASAIGIAALVAAKPDAVYDGTVGSRTAFGLMFTACIFGGALGVVDAMFAGDRRARAIRARTTFAVGPGGAIVSRSW